MKIVAILNLTPDSFSDGGKHNTLDTALQFVRRALADGASIIDVGAESTRPGAMSISTRKEWERLQEILPAVILEAKKLNREVSIDTRDSMVAANAVKLGVSMINDVSGLNNPQLVDLVRDAGMQAVLMHSLRVPTDPKVVIDPRLDVVEEILKWGERKISLLINQGIIREQLIFDPGIGFGKTATQSIAILAGLKRFRELGLPLYVGHSNKSFLDDKALIKLIPGVTSKMSRAQKTAAVTKYLAALQVEYVRVHDVKENMQHL